MRTVGFFFRPFVASVIAFSTHDARQPELSTGHGERDHDLDDRSAAGEDAFGRRLHEGSHLHRVETRLHDAEAHAAGAEHGVELVPRARCCEERLLVCGQSDRGFLDLELVDSGQELVKRWVEEAHGDRKSVHCLEDLDEVGLLDDPQLFEGLGLVLAGLGEDHPPHHRKAVLAEEHVLGAAKADALRAELSGIRRVGAVVGVCTNGELPLADLVGPPEDHVELGRRLGQR